MRSLIKTFILSLLIIGCTNSTEKEGEHSAHTTPEAEATSKPKSPKKMAMSNVGDNHVHIEYSSPGKRGRVIFGGLVAYGEVWVTGAHRATSISFSENVVIGDVNIEKGKYALFTIPGEDSWTVIINKNWDQHLADDYDQSEDLVRLNVEPTTLVETMESLTYNVEEIDENTGSISIGWDNIMLSFEVRNQ